MKLPASSIGHVICSVALIVLVFTMQFYYAQVVNNIWAEMVRRELREITDYVSDSLANLYFLANSTNSNVALEKTLNLPSDVKDSNYVVEIVYETGRSAQSIDAYIEGKSWIDATSWILPGLKVETQNQVIRSGGKGVIAGCLRNSTNIYVWLKQV